MENFGKTRKANLPFENTLNSFSLNRLQINGIASGYDLKESNVKTFSRNIHNENKNDRNRKFVNNNGKADSYIFSADKGTVETKRSKISNSSVIDDITENEVITPIKKDDLKRVTSTRVIKSVHDKYQSPINQQKEEVNSEDFENSDQQPNVQKKKSRGEFNQPKPVDFENSNHHLNNQKQKSTKGELNQHKPVIRNDDAFIKPSSSKPIKVNKDNGQKNEDDIEEYSTDDDHEKADATPHKNVLIIPDLKREISQLTTSKSISNIKNVSESFQKEFEESLNDSDSSLNHVLISVPSDNILKCCIKRSSHRLPVYTMYLEKQDGNYEKLLVGNTISKLPKTYIRIFAVKTKKDVENNMVVLGKLKANVTNNQFVLNGFENVSDAILEDDGVGSDKTEEILNITYKDSSIFSVNKISQFSFVIPSKKNNKNTSRFSTNSGNFFFKYSTDSDSVEKEFKSKMPKFNEKKGAYTLNFNGRVSETSAHNFQVINKSEPDNLVMQFGKIGKDTFICDLSILNPFQAFGVALSNLCR